MERPEPMSLTVLGPPPIGERNKDAPSTLAAVPHQSPTRAALPAPVPPGCHHPPTCPAALHDTKTPVQSLPTCHFHTPSSSCLPSAAVLAFLPVPFSALFLFFPTFCLFLTLSPPVSLSLSLSALHASICSPSPHSVQHWDDHNLPFPQQGQEPLDSPGPHSSQRAPFLAQLTLHSRLGGRSP